MARRRHARRSDLVGGCAARRGMRDRGGRARRLRARAPAGPPRRCPARPWGSACSTTSPSPRATRRTRSGSTGSRSSTGTSTTATAPRRSSGATTRCSSSRCTSGRSTPARGGPGHERRDDAQRPARGRPGDADYAAGVRASIVEPAVAAFEPDLLLVSAGFDAHVDDPLAEMAVTEDGFTELARRCARSSARGSRPCSRAATTSPRCPGSWTLRSAASTPPRPRR